MERAFRLPEQWSEVRDESRAKVTELIQLLSAE